MRQFTDPVELQQYALELKRSGRSIVLVPTMGALHAGHASLIDLARQQQYDKVIVSIFVNPIQFGAGEDLSRYPRTPEKDLELCRAHGADAVFLPTSEVMYPDGASTFVEETMLSRPLCGARRPGHFRGVTTVVCKLFNLSQCDAAVFGMKDAQQLLIIKRMVRDLNMPVRILAAPLVREESGLALSSRNRYLSDGERESAVVLSRVLAAGKAAIAEAGLDCCPAVVEAMKHEITAAGGKVDYVEVLDMETLESPDGDSRELLLALAAYFGKTRLIDNMSVEIKK